MLKRIITPGTAILAGITILAAFLRAWQLDAIPPGLHYDEAFHALQAREMIQSGIIPLWLEGNFGVPPLFAFLVSLSFRLFGESPLAERLVSVIAGTVTVPVLYLLVREVLGTHRVALLSALLLAVSFQGLVFSREGLEPHLVPLFLSAGLYLLWRGWRTGRWLTLVAAGLVFGIGSYTYQAYWLSPLVVAPLVLWRLIAGRPAADWRRPALCAAVALLVAAPLLPHLLGQVAPGSRLAQIATTSSEAEQSGIGALLSNAAAVATMFTFVGDPDPRNNLPGRPMLDPFLGVAFAVGFVVCLRRIRQPEYGHWLLWLAVMSLPVALSEFAPHFRRAIGLLPPVTVLAAIGLDATLSAFAGSRLPAMIARRAAPAIISLGVLASGLAVCRDYFVLLGPTNEYYYAFDTGLADMARYVNTRSTRDRVYLLPADNRHTTLQFLAAGKVPRSYESRQVWVLPPADTRETVYVAVTMEDPGALGTLRRAFPQGRVVHEGRDREGGVYFTAYSVPAGSRAAVAPATTLSATLGSSVALVGLDLPPVRDGRLTATVWWRCLQPMQEDYTAFVHLVGRGGLAAQRDAQPGGGSYPTSRWEQGETIADRFVLDVSGAGAGEYELVTGMYLLATQRRLSVTDGEGRAVPGDAASLASFRLP